MSGMTRIAYVCVLSVSCLVLLVSCEAVTAQQITYPLVHEGPGTGFPGGGRPGRDAGGGQHWRRPGMSDGLEMNPSPVQSHSPDQSHPPEMYNPLPMNSLQIEDEMPKVPGLPNSSGSRQMNEGGSEGSISDGSSSRNRANR
ncbi:hypothetical protein [Paenibacillus sp. FSL K6-1230]|uniref:hypothetical protein n=1 Tax=Paenibacillus sp. FSL K6-1230 TaxID=2921603 RepID=UPI0030F989BD